MLAHPRGRGTAATVSATGAVGWLLAEGTETATTEGREPVELAYGWAELARNACGSAEA